MGASGTNTDRAWSYSNLQKCDGPLRASLPSEESAGESRDGDALPNVTGHTSEMTVTGSSVQKEVRNSSSGFAWCTHTHTGRGRGEGEGGMWHAHTIE